MTTRIVVLGGGYTGVGAAKLAAALYKEAIVRGTVVFENHPTIPASL